MSQVVGEGVVHVSLDDRDVNKQMPQLGKSGGKQFSSGFAGSIKGLAAVAGGALVATKVLSFAKASVAEARESQKVSAATQQIIKSTGGAAKIAAGQVGDLANAISLKTGIDDEAIQSGSNLLLTFTGVRNEVGKGNDVFNQATQAAVDLSAAGFGSITGASVQLGKALNDPIKGISALSRSGVTFTAQQQAQIKAMVAAGNTLGAQKIILGGVQQQVGGVAAATATAGEKAATAFGNIKEAIGTALLPAIDAAENGFTNKIAPAIFATIAGAGKLGPVFGTIGGFLSRLGPPLHDAQQALSVFFQVLRGGAVTSDSNSPIVMLAFRLGALAKKDLPLVIGAIQRFAATAFPVIQQLAKAFVANLLPVLKQASDTFRHVILPAVIGLVTYVAANLLPILKQLAGIVVTEVLPTIKQLALFFYGTLYPAVVQIVTVVAKQLKPVFDQLVTTFNTSILPAVKGLVAQIRTQLLPVLEPLVVHILQVVGVVLKLAAAILAKVLPPLIRLAAFILTHVVPVIVKLITIAVRIINSLFDFGAAIVAVVKHISGFGDSLNGLVRGAIHDVVQAVINLPQTLLNLGPKFLHAGSAIIGKFLDGLKNAGGAAKGIVGGIWGALKGLINGAIDGINNALEFTIGIGFGKHITINAPDIPHLAVGTANFAGGMARVGEEGPENVWMPPGSRVWTARDSAAGAGQGAGIYIAQQTVVAHDYHDYVAQQRRASQQAALGGRRNPR